MKVTRITWEQAGDGWLRYRNPDVPLDVYVRPLQLDDRFVIGEIRVANDQAGVRSGALKMLRLGPIEAAMNREGIRVLAVAANRGGPYAAIFSEGTQVHRSYDLEARSGPGGKYPDEFYREVAGFYMAMLEAGNRPAPELAAATGKPVATVHRWVAKARNLGYLPKGRPGKAG